MAKLMYMGNEVSVVGYSGGGGGGSSDDLKFVLTELYLDYYINPANGEPVPEAGDAMTQFIEVNPSRYIALGNFIKQWGGANYAAWYDENKDFISALDMTVSIQTAPANAKYMRLSHTFYSMNLLDVFVQGEANT